MSDHWKFLKQNFEGSSDENWGLAYFKAKNSEMNLLEPLHLREIVQDVLTLQTTVGTYKGNPVPWESVIFSLKIQNMCYQLRFASHMQKINAVKFILFFEYGVIVLILFHQVTFVFICSFVKNWYKNESE